MSVVEEFENIVLSQKENLIFPFLQKLTKKDKSLLYPITKNVFKNTLDAWLHSNTTKSQENIVFLSAFVILNYKDYSRMSYRLPEILDEKNVLSWYCPAWFSQYWNNMAHDRVQYHIDYPKLIEYKNNGYIKPSNELIAFIIGFSNPNKIKNISEFKKDIWFLFEYSSTIHTPYDIHKDIWLKFFLEFSKISSINRTRIIEKSFEASTKNFNKTATGFFFDIIINLNPSDKELINLQDSLFITLQSQHSKPINQILKYLKRIYKEPDFDLEGFIEQVPLLLSWDVKAVVNGTLSLIDALIKAYPTHKDELALLVVQTLGQEDESLQIKAVKLLGKHKLLETQSILDEIHIYNEGLYHSTKQLLPSLDVTEVKKETIEIIPPQRIREDNIMPIYESFDELVFFFSQVFEGNNVYDFDLFVDLLPKLNLLLNEDNIDKLSPAFDRAYKSYIKWGSSENIDYSDIVFAMISCFISYARLLIERFPKQTKSIQKSQTNLDKFFSTLKQEREEEYQRILDGKFYMQNKNNFARERHLKRLETEPCHGHICLIDFESIEKTSNILYIFHKRLQSIWKELVLPNNFISFSTPTHTPAWIDISTLMLRLENQKDDNIIDPIDMQIALMRVINPSNKHIKINIKNEIGDILDYLFNDAPLDIDKIETPAYWQIAILRKENMVHAKLFTNRFYPSNPRYNILNRSQWHLITEASFHTQFNSWGNFSHYKKYVYPNKIKFKYKRTLLKSPFDSLFKHGRLDDIKSSDIARSLLLYPTMPHHLINAIEYPSHSYRYDTEPNRVKYSITMLQLFNDIWLSNNHEITYLFLTRKLIDENKSIRTLASELWIKSTNEGTMNQQLLGQTLGKLEHNEYAPLKRFTDLIVANMLNISTLHNKGLHTLLSNMIAHMNDEPIKGTKKLLEIYLEVLSVTGLEVPHETMQKLRVWGEVKSLKSVVKKILSSS